MHPRTFVTMITITIYSRELFLGSPPSTSGCSVLEVERHQEVDNK